MLLSFPLVLLSLVLMLLFLASFSFSSSSLSYSLLLPSLPSLSPFLQLPGHQERKGNHKRRVTKPKEKRERKKWQNRNLALVSSYLPEESRSPHAHLPTTYHYPCQSPLPPCHATSLSSPLTMLNSSSHNPLLPCHTTPLSAPPHTLHATSHSAQPTPCRLSSFTLPSTPMSSLTSIKPHPRIVSPLSHHTPAKSHPCQDSPCHPPLTPALNNSVCRFFLQVISSISSRGRNRRQVF